MKALMDMRRRTGPWLSGAAVHALGGRYDGTIRDVVEQDVRNKWTGATTREVVIVFEDLKQLVLNQSTQFELMERFGPESDEWIGQTIAFVSRAVSSVDTKTGEVKARWERVLLNRAEGNPIDAAYVASDEDVDD
jgi:hypothetical protein